MMESKTEPLMVDLPAEIATGRFVLRPPRPGDGPLLNAAVCASIESLRLWMPWAQRPPTPEESELECRRMAARFVRREDLPLFIIEPGPGGAERIVGGTGLHRIDWNVPRFEIGYWRRSGDERRGVIVEAVTRLTRLAFDQLRAMRVEIRMAATNAASRRVAERAGYTFEGLLRRDSLGVDGLARDSLVYSRVRGVEETS